MASCLPFVPPRSLCLLRTSALGDASHVVPLVRTLQANWPETKLTWIIGKLERRLVGDIAGVEFITFDKAAGLEGFRCVRAALAGRRFDALLHLQVALRANLLSLLVHAPLRIGYDRARAKELHGLVVNRRIPTRSGQHVVDAIGSFVEPLGLSPQPPRWDIPIPDEARDFAERHLPGDQPTLLVSPCSSHALRNWRAERYAAVIDHAVSVLGWRAVLCGGPSAYERAFGDDVLAACRHAPLDLIGKDTLKQLLALLQRSTLVLSPDSGPMHFANAVGTPVLGLHAATNPDRSGPYSDRQWCVNRYDEAARRFRGKPSAELPWGTRIQHEGVMDLIDVDAVIQQLERFHHERVAGSGDLPDPATAR